MFSKILPPSIPTILSQNSIGKNLRLSQALDLLELYQI